MRSALSFLFSFTPLLVFLRNVFPPVTPCCPEVQFDLPRQGGVRRRPRTYVFLLC